MREQPPYLVIANQLRHRVTSGEWPPGQRLPSRAEFAQQYDVGDNVVRRAQELLISQGLLEARAGSGTYVAQARERLRMVRWWGGEQGGGARFFTDMAGLGMRGSWEHSTEPKVPAPPEIAERLGIAEGDMCVRTAYEFKADGKTIQLSTSWEPHSLTSGTIVVLPEGGPYAGRGVVGRMAVIDLVVTHVIERPEPRRATAEEASLLGVQTGSQVTHIRRTHVCEDGRPAETADIIVPAAHCEIVYKIPVDQP